MDFIKGENERVRRRSTDVKNGYGELGESPWLPSEKGVRGRPFGEKKWKVSGG